MKMLPKAFLDRMQQTLGEEYGEFLESLQKEKYQALRLNGLKSGADSQKKADLEARLQEALGPLRPVRWAEDGYYYAAEAQPGKHPYHAAGMYYIQEPSAMAPGEFLEVRPGERVLDLCAAPGGKSTQLAAKLKGEGFLLCNEIHPARAKILSENIERMGVRNACVANETPERLAERFQGFFDKILVDAPCSGEGMFRKNEAACEEWSPENVRLCAERQDGILDCGAKMLRPGGRLVYSTCTFAAEEDEGSVERFLDRHSDFRLAPIEVEAKGLSGCEGRLPGTVKLLPHRAEGEGHFFAVLEREGTVSRGQQCSISGGLKSVPEKELGEYLSFCRENLRLLPGEQGSRYLWFGDNLYLVPEETPELKGLKILRPGLHLGELKKNRFEPSHALALALSPEEAIHVWSLRADDLAAAAYLTGQTFSAEGEKGWYLICVGGFSLGWGKLSGGVMKNHYPRGLRVNL